MLQVFQQLEIQLQRSIAAAFPEAADQARLAGLSLDPQLAAASKPEFGDFQANGALALARTLQLKPRAIAEQIVDQLRIDPEFTSLCLDPQIAGPG